MGILDENLDDLLENCKQTAEIALLSVKEHAENLDRNFEELGLTDDDRSLGRSFWKNIL